MKHSIFQEAGFLTVMLLTGLNCFTAEARLPIPYKHQGSIASIDESARLLVLIDSNRPIFKLGHVVKPTRFIWDAATQFLKAGRTISPNTMTPGDHVEMEYIYTTSKQPPVLLKVMCDEATK